MLSKISFLFNSFSLLFTMYKKFVPRTLQRIVEMIYSMRYFSFLQNNSPPPYLQYTELLGGGRVGGGGVKNLSAHFDHGGMG